ncbi:MAG TPA: hypothetical protein VIY48_03895 [Candidatus Paceibacterota bacterium]
MKTIFKRVVKSVDKAMDKAALFNWSKLVPSVKTTQFEKLAFGIEPTWGNSGLGLALGLGKIDLWMGWPRT